mgnify:CR=1 FL=1
MTSWTAVVTGGAKGIGLAISDLLASEGWNVVLTGRDEAALQNAVSDLSSSHKDVTIIGKVMDVQDLNSVNTTFDEIGQQFGSLEALVNCAGIVIRENMASVSDDTWLTVINTNLTGAFRCSKAALPLLKAASNGASIVNISSIAGTLGIAGRTSYTASKAGLEGLTRTLALELAEFDIRVNGVAPGWTRTEMVDRGINEGKIDLDEVASRIALKRFADPEEIANVVSFMISDAASYITGQTLLVDGGITINGNT